jgi:hypothetical protein
VIYEIGVFMTPVAFAIVMAFGLLYMAVVNEERHLLQAARLRKR